MSASASRPESVRLLYVCLERIAPGSAAATHVGEICAGLRRRGIAVELIAETGERRSGLMRQVVRYTSVLGRAALALRRNDAVYMRSHFAGLPLAWFAAICRRPVLHEINGTYADALVTHPAFRRIRATLGWMQRAQYRGAAALIAVTPDLARWGRDEAGHGRVHVVPNAANTQLFRPDGERTMRAQPYVLFFGGLTRWHGVDTMLQAAADPDWPAGLDLVVAGPIVDPALGQGIRDAPAPVAYLGPVAQADLPALIRGAVAVLVPISDPGGRSAKGVLPLKLYEALGCGLPVVVTDLPGQADLVRSGRCGLVVPVGDAGALARAVATLSADREQAARLGANGARLVATEHSWDARAGDTEAILRTCIKGWR